MQDDDTFKLNAHHCVKEEEIIQIFEAQQHKLLKTAQL